MNYKVIEDPRVITFYKKCTTKKFKNITGIKFPWFGKNRGKMLIPEGVWGQISSVYLENGGNVLPDNIKVDADYL